MNVYTISGLGADKRVFKYLNIGLDVIHLDWIVPLDNESLKSYALRLAQKIDTSEDFYIIGVSFGGMIAVEIEKILNPKQVIIISSAQVISDINPIFKWIGRSGVLNILPLIFFNPPKKQMSQLFAVANEHLELFYEILRDGDPKFTRWAMQQITGWKNSHLSSNVKMIHGTKDKILKCPSRSKIIKLEGEGHAMILNKAKELNAILKKLLS